MKKLPLVPAALCGLMLLLALLYAAVASFTFSRGSYPQEPPYDAMATELTEYLSGRQPALSDALFTERERLHMVDVLALFQGGRAIGLVALIGGLALGVLAAFTGGRHRLGQGILIGIGLFLVLAAGIGLWAAIDFDGWFRTMHELIFTNDLWLLDPAESALIRMLPLDFFIRAVQAIAIRFGLGGLALGFFALWLQRRPHAISG